MEHGLIPVDYLKLLFMNQQNFLQSMIFAHSASLNKKKEILSYMKQITTTHIYVTVNCAVNFPNYRNKQISFTRTGSSVSA